MRQKIDEIVTPELSDGAIINTRHPGFKEDYLVLHCLIRKYKPASLFEIGTNDGFGTKIIKNAIGDGQIISMDLPIEEFRKLQKYPEKIGQACDLPYVQVYGDSLTFNFQKAACEAYFVDGAHDYEHVYHEASEILKLEPRLIIFHDADIPAVFNGLGDALLRFKSDKIRYGVFTVENTRICYALKLADA